MKKIIFILCLYLQVANSQNNYGEFTYPHSNGSIMSSGITSTVAGQPGFIMAGYNSNAAPYHFTIDRTDKGGAFTGSTFEFQKDYSVFADVAGSCILPNCTPINSSRGVSIIQTTLSVIGARYALVGSFDEGFFLCFINGAGSVINTNIFWFPFPAGTNPSTITRPLIKEDPFNPGNYYVCGSYSSLLYAMKIDYNGVPAWSYVYPINGQANDMTVSTSGDPVIVGHTSFSNVVPDGFVLNLAGSLGTASFFKIYDYGNYHQSFSSISQAANPGVGYIIGGVCEVTPGNAKAYNLNVDAGGNKNWDNVIQFNSDATAGNIVGILERNAFYGYEYFGVMSSTAGIIVARMDDNGVPCWGAPAPTVSRVDEFLFNAPGANLGAIGISYLDAPAGYDEGLHIFGTDNNSASSAPYLAQSYFDGHSGCNTPGFHFTTSDSICNYSPFALTTGTGLSPCNAIYILDVPTASKINYCGPASSVANSSNLRTTAVEIIKNQYLKDFFVAIDPQRNLITIDCKDCGYISEVYIKNLLGQTIYHNFIVDDKNLNGKIIFSDTNIQTGSYMIVLSTEKGIVSKKFLYSEN